MKHTKYDAIPLVGEDVLVVSSLSVQRRKQGETGWTEIRVINVITSDALDFELLDYTARSFVTYEYRCALTTEDAIYYEPVFAISTKYAGIVIANAKQAYVCVLNPEITHQREFSNTYIRPYNSKYPHVIQNGLANSSKGTVSGYFNPLDEQCGIEAKYGDYAEQFENYLSDGTSKLLKAPDGRAWYVQIDTPVKLSYDKILGVIKADFSWTEIGKIPEKMNVLVG